MKKSTLLQYCIMALFLVFASCSKDENEIILEDPSAVVEELEFVEKDGSFGLDEAEIEEGEEEAPAESAFAKSYNHYDYTLLKPSGLKQRDVDSIKCGDSKTLPLLVGSYKKKVGRVTVSNDGENLYVTFKANRNRYMKKVYLYIGEKTGIPFYSNGFPKLREFNFKAFPYYYGGMKKATYVIPLSSINLDCFEIVAYSKVYDKKSRCYYSAFAYNKNLTQGYSYSGYSGCYYYDDWVRSFEYCVQKCEAECVQAYGFHEECGFCENDVFNTFLAYAFIDRNGPAGFNIELITNPDGCDISNSTEVGHFNVAAASETTLKIEYQVNAGYEMCEIDFNYGTSRLNTPNNYSKVFDTPVTTFSFEIERLSGANIYMNSGAKITTTN
ncbi:hypothetical protein [Aquimarina sp. MMG016]|uniref:hypothetical protein n=1 Tax=Aquimarina sp. MMG016 TaxID=2822690 RepID=UPI001B3A6D96|nr:hypothetical protein [Aquimarina sp. MMG016]MBQ4822381.1 hypothetical protein [Aquimarina sp. MMG016]